MFIKVIKILIGFLMPRDDEGSVRFGIRHTATAASILGCFIFKMNGLYYTRLEAVQNNSITFSKISAVEADSQQTKIFAYTQLQRVDDKWDEIKNRLDGLESHLKRIEKNKNFDALSANLNHNIENKN